MSTLKDKFKTSSGFILKNCYSKANSKSILTENSVSGEFPYTRGIHSEMYRDRSWTMRQYAGFGSAKESNERYKYLLQKGVSGLSVAFDLPTQMGLDPDSQLATGEVGRVGVSIASVEDMHTLFKDIDLNSVSISMTINSTAPILLAYLLVVAEETNVPFRNLRGTIQNDILKEYIARGTYIYPPKESLKLIGSVFNYCKNEVPKWNTISISGYHMREAGATALQELSFTFANAITYIDTAIEHGLTIDEVAPQMSFFFNCHNNFLEEVSKFRAARVIWARITKEIYKAKNPKSSKLRFHTQTAGSTLTASQPHNNIIRTSIQAMASVLGGTQSLHTNGFDEALGLPTEQSAEIALRTQQIIANETGITDTSDPLGGSYVIENLTSQLIDESFKELDKIKSMGGMLSAIEEEYPQKSIEESAYEYQKELEKKEKLIVGVNCYNEKDDSKVPIYKLNAKIAKNQIKSVIKLKKKRNVEEVKNTLRDLETVVRENRNAMPYIITAAKNRATLGEISDAIKKVYGSYSGKF